MRAAATVANLVQMVIVLAVFILQGVSLGGLTILALFFLLIIACFNLLVLLFSGNADQETLMTDKKTIIKRRDFRVIYALGAQPKLCIGDQWYDVLDIAESGVRIAVGRHERLRKRFKCKINLLCGEIYTTKVIVIRREADETALAFNLPIEYRVLLKERQTVAVPQP